MDETDLDSEYLDAFAFINNIVSENLHWDMKFLLEKKSTFVYFFFGRNIIYGEEVEDIKVVNEDEGSRSDHKFHRII